MAEKTQLSELIERKKQEAYRAHEERILRRHEVEHKTGLARSSIYELIADGKFPKPVRLTSHSVGWLASEIEAWIAERVAERDAA